jgi:hypothetical protein
MNASETDGRLYDAYISSVYDKDGKKHKVPATTGCL